MRKQLGFTLIELMISLVLGLLIMAAAFKLFYTGLLSNNIQQAGSQLVGSSVFGADHLTRHLQRANLGSLSDSENGEGDFLNHLTALGGVVLTAPTDMSVFGTELPGGAIVGNNLRGLNYGGGLISSNWLSKDGGGTNSDQLTIQYQAREPNKTDCMGRLIKKDDYVIERYFVRDGGLACASAIYTYDKDQAKGTNAGSNAKNGVDISVYNNPDGTTGRNDLGGSGQIIVPDVESFQILMGLTDSRNFVSNPSDMTIKYMPIPAKNTLNTVFGLDTNTGRTTHRIVAMQVGLLLRANNPVKAVPDSYSVLDATITPANDGRVRNVYTSNILIRNARGII